MPSKPHIGVWRLVVRLALRVGCGNVGVWRSWLARALWEREVEGSSPFTPTKKRHFTESKVFFI